MTIFSSSRTFPGATAAAAVVLMTGAFCSPAKPAAAQAAVPVPARLTVVPTRDITASGAQRGTFDFGETNLLDTLKITRTFTLRNDGDASLAIERLKGSCGCTSVVAGKTKSGSPAPPADGSPVATLAPGEELSFDMTVDLTHLAPGPQRKFVFVYVAGNRDPVATCEVKGRLLPSVALSPMPLDFGSVTAGKERTLTVTAAFDPRLASLSVTPLASSNPAVGVIPVAAPTGAGTASGRILKAYRVTVARDAPLGSLMGVLWFPPVASGEAAGTKRPAAPNVNVSEAMSSARLTFAGQVVGDIAAEPRALAMGITVRGSGAAGRIVLTGASAAALQNLKITCDSPWLAARPAAMDTSGAKPTRSLEIMLAPGAPAGSLQASLTLSLPNGQRLLVPVSAYVKPERTPLR